MNPHQNQEENKMALEKFVKDLTFNDLAKRARDDSEAFATYIIGEKPQYRSGREVRFYENQSLVVFISGGKKGKFKSFADESARGDLFDLWKYIKGGTNHDAVMGYKNFAGLNEADPQKVVQIKAGPSEAQLKKEEDQLLANKISAAQNIWRNSSDTKGRDEGIQYLKGRNINIVPGPEVLKFRILSPEEYGRIPGAQQPMPKSPVVALVFAATNANGEITAVQQIFTCEGKKLKCDRAKVSRGALTGSSVKLGDFTDAKKVQMAEGPETSLSMHEANGVPTLISLGKANYTNVDLPNETEEFIIGTDMDASGTGLASSLKAVQYWSNLREDLRAGIAIPRLNDGDFNDVAQKNGVETVRATIQKSFFPIRTRKDDALLVTPDAKVAFHAYIKTGIMVQVPQPALNKQTNQRSPIQLDSAIPEDAKAVLLIGKDGYTFDDTYVVKHRPDVQLINSEVDADEFLKSASEIGYVQDVIQKVDLYAPNGIGEKDAMAFCLRRKDADALISAGHRAVAVRPSEISNIDFSFMKGRKAIVTPLGKGSEYDRELFAKLNDFGCEPVKLTWQIFAPDGDTLKIIRQDIPKDYSAAEAVAEGWKGKAMADLLLISQLNMEQAEIMPSVKRNIEEAAVER